MNQQLNNLKYNDLYQLAKKSDLTKLFKKRPTRLELLDALNKHNENENNNQKNVNQNKRSDNLKEVKNLLVSLTIRENDNTSSECILLQKTITIKDGCNLHFDLIKSEDGLYKLNDEHDKIDRLKTVRKGLKLKNNNLRSDTSQNNKKAITKTTLDQTSKQNKSEIESFKNSSIKRKLSTLNAKFPVEIKKSKYECKLDTIHEHVSKDKTLILKRINKESTQPIEEISKVKSDILSMLVKKKESIQLAKQKLSVYNTRIPVKIKKPRFKCKLTTIYE